MQSRATLLAIVDTPGEVDAADRWLAENAAALSFVSEMQGCGCCVMIWDVQGPSEVIATLPANLSSVSEWASSAPDA
jgi:hypothetical protein